MIKKVDLALGGILQGWCKYYTTSSKFIWLNHKRYLHRKQFLLHWENRYRLYKRTLYIVLEWNKDKSSASLFSPNNLITSQSIKSTQKAYRTLYKYRLVQPQTRKPYGYSKKTLSMQFAFPVGVINCLLTQ